jgi:hypothetical protein
VIVHVVGPALSTETPRCLVRLRAPIVGGGTLITCLTSFRGMPGPNALVRVKGTMTFRLRHRTRVFSVLVVDRFAADGRHATQRVTGKGISGGGTFVEDPPGHVRASSLTYRLP